MKTVGIFGGTFSPPHNGHIHAVKEFLLAEDPDEMLIIPTSTPPHKELKGNASPEQRLRMCELAFDFDSRIRVSDVEIRRGGKSYTSDTLQLLAGEDTHLVFLCGTDMFLTMDTWHCPEKIFALADVVLIRRENEEKSAEDLRQKANEYKERFGAVIRFVDAPPLPLSSTACRESEGLSGLVPPLVKEYIEKCKLYRE